MTFYRSAPSPHAAPEKLTLHLQFNLNPVRVENNSVIKYLFYATGEEIKSISLLGKRSVSISEQIRRKGSMLSHSQNR